MILYPQLPRAVAEQLGEERRGLDVQKAAGLAADDHPDVVFTPTGGTRATSDDLRRLRTRLLQAAEQVGYPNGDDEQSRISFDKPAAGILHASMQLAPAEAAKSGLWEFLSCVLLCDLVRWRFPGGADGSPIERFLSGRRNTFQRLWWRAFVLQEEHQSGDPYRLLGSLGEDEVVQIMERPFLAGSRALSRTVAMELLSASERHPGIARRVLIREAQKRVRRLAAFTSFEAIGEAELGPLVRSVFDQVAVLVK